MFEKHLGPEVANAILRRRIIQLAEEGYQHELNADFIHSELKRPAMSAEERTALVNELSAAEQQITALRRALEWHLSKLEQD